MLLLLLTTLSSAPLVATPPRPPDTVMPVVAVTVAAETDATPKALLDVNVACFPERAVDTLPIPVTVSAPPTVTDELSTAAPSHCSSRVAMTSRPWMSALAVRLVIDSCELELIDAPAFAAIRAVMS